MNIANRYTGVDINRLIEIKKSGAFDEVAQKLTAHPSPRMKPIKTYTEVELAPKIQAKLAQHQALKSTPYTADELTERIESKLAAHQVRKARTIAMA